MSLPNMQASPVSADKFRTRHGTAGSGPISLAAERQLRTQYRAAAVEDMAHKAVGLETSEFLKVFFPLPADVSPDDRPRWDGDMFKDVEDAQNMVEAKISEAFIKALTSMVGLTPNLTLAESQHCPDQGADASGLKVDAGFFRPDFVPTDGRPHWADQTVPIEFKSQDTRCDPYDDRPKFDISAGAIKRKEVRGQLIDYAEEVFRYQHRTELYMLLILGRRFRFLRWDRSGTVVTPSMDYVENPDLLCEMLWRMSLLNDEQLGLDPTAVRVRLDTDDYKDMDAAVIPQPSDVDHADRVVSDDELIPEQFVFRYVRENFANSLGGEWPRYRLEVPHGKGVRKFLVGKSSFRASGMAGRGTRGYIALDYETRRFVWLKDAWRAHYEFVDQEGTVLKDLNKVGVQHVPTLICHGDIRNQVTRTPEFWKPKNLPTATSPSSPHEPPNTPSNQSSSRTLAAELQPKSVPTLKRGRSQVDDSDLSNGDAPRDDCPLRWHKHYRLVVREVCMPLVKFQSGQQLLEIVLTCVIAHRDAMNNAKIVHRDVSGGNILILPTLVHDPQTNTRLMKWWGILADWELSKPVHSTFSPSARARQPECTGTWQYMSVATLQDHTKVIETPDELESFFHVILYYGVRYLTSNCTDVGHFIEDFFDSYTLVNKRYLCGKAKSTAMYNGKLQFDDADTETDLKFSSPLDVCLRELLKLFKAHYAVVRYRKRQAEETTITTQRPSTVAPVLDAGDSSRTRTPFLLHLLGMTAPEPAPLPKIVDDPEDEEPTETQKTLALQVQSHACMVTALSAALRARDEWPKSGDRVAGDNVSVDFTPKCAVGPTPMASTKRRRIEPTSSPTAGHSSANLPGPRTSSLLQPQPSAST